MFQPSSKIKNLFDVKMTLLLPFDCRLSLSLWTTKLLVYYSKVLKAKLENINFEMKLWLSTPSWHGLKVAFSLF